MTLTEKRLAALQAEFQPGSLEKRVEGARNRRLKKGQPPSRSQIAKLMDVIVAFSDEEYSELKSRVVTEQDVEESDNE